jgi:hypothetical protein
VVVKIVNKINFAYARRVNPRGGSCQGRKLVAHASEDNIKEESSRAATGIECTPLKKVSMNKYTKN